MSLNFWRTVLSGLFGGTVAGILLGLLILLLVTPLIVKAEKFEHAAGLVKDEHASLKTVEQVKEGQEHHSGTVVGSILLGLIYGLIVTLIFWWFSGSELTFAKGLKLGLIGFLVTYLIPSFFVFPPNPPGVETKASVAVRQSWWLAVIGVELLVLWFYRWFKQQFSISKAYLFAAVSFVLIAWSFSYLAPNTLAKLAVPESLLLNFRLASLLVMFIFWLTLGLLTGFTYSWLVAAKAPVTKTETSI
jgi:predicted cobalt transporter CbtA